MLTQISKENVGQSKYCNGFCDLDCFSRKMYV